MDNNNKFIVKRSGTRGVVILPPENVKWNVHEGWETKKRGLLVPSTLTSPTGGTLGPERHHPTKIQSVTTPEWWSLVTHSQQRAKELIPVLASLADANSRGLIKPSDKITVEGALWIDSNNRRKDMALAHRSLGQVKANGLPIQNLAALRSCISLFFQYAKPYASTDLLPWLWNAWEWQLFESNHVEAFGARSVEETIIQEFVSELTPEQDPNLQMILDYANEIKEEGIERPLEWAIESSPCDEAAEVFTTEKKVTGETIVTSSDVTQSLDALESSASIDAS